MLRKTLGALSIFALLGIVAIANAHDPFEKERGSAIRDRADSRNLDDGEEQYNTNCASCHGVDGKANLPAAKRFHATDLIASEMTDENMYAIIFFGGGVTGFDGLMPAFGRVLGHQGVEDVIGHIRVLQQQAK